MCDFKPLLPEVVLVEIPPHAININFTNELSPSQTPSNAGEFCWRSVY